MNTMNYQLLQALCELTTLPEETQEEYAAMIWERLDTEVVYLE